MHSHTHTHTDTLSYTYFLMSTEKLLHNKTVIKTVCHRSTSHGFEIDVNLRGLTTESVAFAETCESA